MPVHYRSERLWTWPCRSPAAWVRRTGRTLFIATSSPKTSFCSPMGRSRFWISVWRDRPPRATERGVWRRLLAEAPEPQPDERRGANDPQLRYLPTSEYRQRRDRNQGRASINDCPNRQDVRGA